MAYFGMFDPNNNNWSILYSGIGSARNAPFYDLDLGFNIPFAYGEEITPERKETTSSYIEELVSGKYLKRYIETFSAANLWFDDFLMNFYKQVCKLDIEKKLLKKKGIHIDTVALKHYKNFFRKQNTVIREYYIDKKLIKPNIIIAFSGIDGSGKTTQINRAQKVLESLGFKTQIIKPKLYTKPDIMSNDSENNKSKMLGMCHQLSDYCNDQNLRQGTDIWLCDRYLLDYRALGQLIGVMDEDVEAILGELPQADLTVFLDTNIKTSLDRIKKRATEKAIEPHENRTTLSRLKSFLSSSVSNLRKQQKPILVINGDNSIEDIHGEIMTRIKEVLMSKKVIEDKKSFEGDEIEK